MPYFVGHWYPSSTRIEEGNILNTNVYDLVQELVVVLNNEPQKAELLEFVYQRTLTVSETLVYYIYFNLSFDTKECRPKLYSTTVVATELVDQ